MKKTGLLFLWLFINLSTAQDISYPPIEKSLKENANSVVREEYRKIDLLDIDELEMTYKRVVTVLNRSGDRDVDAYVHFRDGTKVKSLKAVIYDENGNKIKTYRKKDFSNLSATGRSTLYTDARYYALKHSASSYPYTVQFEYELTNETTGFIYPWLLLSNPSQSVVKSVYEITDDAKLGLKHRISNFENYPSISYQDKNNRLVFTAENLPAYRNEAYQPSRDEFIPNVYFSLQQFSLHGVDAEVNSWKEFGTWMYTNLIHGRDEVSKETTREVLQLVEGVNDPIQRAKIVYEYVQNKMRYVNVAIGIGGWEPISALDVDRVKYGDCKGLTNYTHALLKLVGVDSYWTILKSEQQKKDMFENFPSIQGNHMILNIPLENEEDIWLECTSAYFPFGYVGVSNSDRNVLVVKKEGGEIKQTAVFADKANLQINTYKLELDAQGNMSAQFEKKSQGAQYSKGYVNGIQKLEDVKKKYKNSWADLPKLNIQDIQFENDKEAVVFTEKIQLTSEGFAKKVGNRLVFNVNPLNASVVVPRKYSERKNPFVINSGFIDEDFYTYILPENYHVDAFPDPFEIDTKFGKYALEIKVEHAKLIVYRRFQLNSGDYAKDEYEEFRNFLIEAQKKDQSKVVIQQD